jgi:hypothetical protein
VSPLHVGPSHVGRVQVGPSKVGQSQMPASHVRAARHVIAPAVGPQNSVSNVSDGQLAPVHVSLPAHVGHPSHVAVPEHVSSDVGLQLYVSSHTAIADSQSAVG